MKPAKWTKDPWCAVGGWIEVERDDIPDIANFWPESMGQGHLHRSTDEMLANAALAADAPNMIRLLVDIAKHYGIENMPSDIGCRISALLEAHAA